MDGAAGRAVRGGAGAAWEAVRDRYLVGKRPVLRLVVWLLRTHRATGAADVADFVPTATTCCRRMPPPSDSQRMGVGPAESLALHRPPADPPTCRRRCESQGEPTKRPPRVELGAAQVMRCAAVCGGVRRCAVVCGAWCVVRGARCAVRGARCAVRGTVRSTAR